MRALMIAAAVGLALAPAGLADAQATKQQRGETRCGWLENPTPGNFWLNDADGQWTIQTQGPEGGPPGWDESPDFTTNGWVETNGSYGYGCACMRVSVNPNTMRVTRFYSGRSVPLAQCRRDRALTEPSGD